MLGRIRAALVALGFTAALAIGSTQALAQQSTLDVVKQRGTLIAGVKSDYPPFGYIDASGNLVGFDIEVMKRPSG